MDVVVPGPNPINIVGDYIEPDLGDGFNALFDLEDMEKVTQHKWMPFHNGNIMAVVIIFIPALKKLVEDYEPTIW
jgi:hypothetical protein